MNSVADLAAQLAALAEPTRLRLLLACRSRAGSVGQLAEGLKLPEPAVSRHLATLAQAGWLVRVRQGREVHYGWSDAARASGWLDTALAPLAGEDPSARRDAARLARLQRAESSASFEADSAFGSRLVAALSPLANNLGGARALAIDVQHGAVLAWLQQTAGSLTLAVRDASLRRAVVEFAQTRGIDFDWLQERGPVHSFDLICLLASDALHLEARLSEAARWLAPRGLLLVGLPYEALEPPAGEAGPHPLFRMRAALAARDLACERLLPFEASGRHWLLASGARTATSRQLASQG